MQVNLKKDSCDRWQFYEGWVPGKELAVWEPGNKWNATAKNRMKYAVKHGFICKYGFEHYNDHLKDVFEINTSAPIRQGREMSEGYLTFPTRKNIDNPCPNHTYHCLAVFHKETVYAYAIVHRMGDIMNISTIIGHKDVLNYGIMLLLADRIQQLAALLGVKAVIYGTWDSGTDGLRHWKHSTGFKPQTLSL